MTKAELAQALGISASMVSRLARRGMPVDCVDRAKRWRKRHIEPGRIKGVRFDPKAQEQQQAALSVAVHEAVQAATQQAGPHLRECLGLLEEAVQSVQQAPEDTPGLGQALDGLRIHLLVLVVGRCGGLDVATLHWWQWCALLPPELEEDERVSEHMEAACLEPLTLAAFHQALCQVQAIPLEQLKAEYLRLSVLL